MPKFVTRETIQSADDVPWEDVPVDEWEKGAVIRMIGLNAKEASSYSRGMVQLDKKGNVSNINLDDFMAKLVVKTAVNEKFERIFTDDDIPWLNTKSALVLKRLTDVAQRLSGMDEEENKKTTKNSEGTPGEDLPVV